MCVPLQLLKPTLTIPIALQGWGHERGVSSNSPNEQLGRDFPDLHPDPRGWEGQSVEKDEDQEAGAGFPKHIFDSDQFDEDAQHAARSMKSWGKCRCPAYALY